MRWFTRWLATIVVVLVFPACGGDDDSDLESATTDRTVTVETECADAPELSEVGGNPGDYPNLAEAVMFAALCWDQGSVRPVWPDGISKQEALAYANRVCGAGFNTPPTPQEWYELHDGSSATVDDFALAIADEIQSGRSRGFGLC